MLECINCGRDNAYCDGVEYVCPDCGTTWNCPEISDENYFKCPRCGEDEDLCRDPIEPFDYACDSCGYQWNANDDYDDDDYDD